MWPRVRASSSLLERKSVQILTLSFWSTKRPCKSTNSMYVQMQSSIIQKSIKRAIGHLKLSISHAWMMEHVNSRATSLIPPSLDALWLMKSSKIPMMKPLFRPNWIRQWIFQMEKCSESNSRTGFKYKKLVFTWKPPSRTRQILQEYIGHRNYILSKAVLHYGPTSA